MNRFLLLTGILLFCGSVSLAQEQINHCYKWQTQVDPKLERIEIDEEMLNEQEILNGIECLLNLKGNKSVARFTGYTRLNLRASSRPPVIKKPATIEVAVLYYISYIFYNNWEHAGSVRLYNLDYKNKPKFNTKKIVKRAYRSYGFWFKNVKKIGLEKAREQKLDLLENSGVSWS